MQDTQILQGIEVVRELVNQTLCSRDKLRVGAFVLSERPLVRDGEVCGLFFCLHGPRLQRLTAIWDLHSGMVLCYGSRGERFVTLKAPHPLESQALCTAC